jgi:hypothetical protein
MASGRRYEMSFFTATILEWKPLLANDRYKDIITNSIRYMVSNNKCRVICSLAGVARREVVGQKIRPTTAKNYYRNAG